VEIQYPYWSNLTSSQLALTQMNNREKLALTQTNNREELGHTINRCTFTLQDSSHIQCGHEYKDSTFYRHITTDVMSGSRLRICIYIDPGLPGQSQIKFLWDLLATFWFRHANLGILKILFTVTCVYNNGECSIYL
jgi:hypothetical protein